MSITTDTADPRTIDRTGVLFAVIGVPALALPFWQFKANRIVLGDSVRLSDALGTLGWVTIAALGAILAFGLVRRPGPVRLAMAAAGLAITVWALGAGAAAQVPEGKSFARIAIGSGFWLLFAAFALMAADALAKMALALRWRVAILIASVAAILLVLSSGWMDDLSVMQEFYAREGIFWREARRHVVLALGSLVLALIVGLPLGIVLFRKPAFKAPVLGVLNMMQTIPSLALFGLMIPILSWVANSVPGAAAFGIAGIGFAPALIALFFYSLLPVVSNTVVGLSGVSASTREAARGLGMTPRQVMTSILLPLALPIILAAVRIVLVQNIGLAVIAGLIGGGGFGAFVFQGLNQTAMDLVLVGALPTVALALVAGVGLDLLIEAMSHQRGAHR